MMLFGGATFILLILIALVSFFRFSADKFIDFTKNPDATVEKTGIIDKLKGPSNIPPCRGTTYAFICKRFRKYEVLIQSDFIRNAKAKVGALIKARDNHPLVLIYRANVEQYSLSDEDLERLIYYIGFDLEGNPKFYGTQYAAIKYGTVAPKANFRYLTTCERVSRSNSGVLNGFARQNNRYYWWCTRSWGCDGETARKAGL